MHKGKAMGETRGEDDRLQAKDRGPQHKPALLTP